MDKNSKVVKIFTLEQQFPCGQGASCCGPIGQSEQEINSLKTDIEKLGVNVEIHNVQKTKIIQEYPQVFKLIRTFGPQAVPVITVGDEVACIGQSDINEVVSSIKSKICE